MHLFVRVCSAARAPLHWRPLTIEHPSSLILIDLFSISIDLKKYIYVSYTLKSMFG